jgi:hypothetical protein
LRAYLIEIYTDITAGLALTDLAAYGAANLRIYEPIAGTPLIWLGIYALARLFCEEYQEFLRVGANEFRVSSKGNAHRP